MSRTATGKQAGCAQPQPTGFTGCLGMSTGTNSAVPCQRPRSLPLRVSRYEQMCTKTQHYLVILSCKPLPDLPQASPLSHSACRGVRLRYLAG
eukprot:15441297-Alexandrium_andersonii.AAC.1